MVRFHIQQELLPDKAQGTAQELLALQNQTGVIDFPNIDTDRLRDTPKARRTKNRLIFQRLGLNENEDLDVRQFINLCANSEKDARLG